ncbi:MAG: hypothetical protein ILP24_03110, partial [Paludibacteraceae bacterium]|nr:hypothetical protein [Paludibacteraceae bacterium]
MNLKQFKNKKFSIFFGLLATASLLPYSLNAQCGPKTKTNVSVLYTDFSPSDPSKTRYSINDLKYSGMSSATLAIPQGGINYNGNSNLGYQNAGDYTIVTNTGSVGAISPYNNQNYLKTLVSKETGGTLLINPRTNDLLNLNVGNLENGKTYKVHFRISNYGTIEGPKAHQGQNYNCDWTGNSMMVGVVIKGGNGGNSDNGNQVNNAKITRTQMTGVSAADAPYVCNKDLNNNISWDVNNGG